MSKNKECTVCGKKYEYCDHCNKYSTGSSWRKSYCSEECRQIFRTCVKYVGGGISQEEAFKLLKSNDVKSKQIQPSVKGTVDEIMNCKVTNVEATVETPNIVDPVDVVDTAIVETIGSPEDPMDFPVVIDEDDEETKPTDEPKNRPRRRRMKKIEE